MTAPQRRLPAPLVVIAPLLVVVLSATGPFDGCDGSGNEPRPLPRDTATSCFDDSDCVPAGCEDLRCVAGVCTERAPIRDRDGDGEAPPPCGEDCDDDDRLIAPGVDEACDLVDQDCDGTIDEMAAPDAIEFSLSTIDPAMAALAWGEDVLVTDVATTPGVLRARMISLETRALGTATTIADLGRDAVVEVVAAKPTADGAWIVLAARMPGGTEIVAARIRRTDTGGIELVGDRETHAAGGDVSAIDLAVIADVPYVAWDEATTRWLWTPGWADAVLLGDALVSGLGPLDLATDGASLVTPVAPSTLAFFDAASGARVATQTLTGELASGRPVADGAGVAWAVVRDASDYSFEPASTTDVGTPSLVPDPDLATTATTLLTVDLLGTRLYFARARAGDVGAGFADTSDPDRATDLPRIVGAVAGPVRSITALDLPAGPVFVTNYGEPGSTVTLLACRPD